MTTLIKSIRTQQALHPKWMRDEFLEPLFVVLTLLGIVLGELLPLMNVSPMLHLFVHLATYFFGGYYAVLAIIEALREKKIEVDLLMVLAALGAAYVDSWAECSAAISWWRSTLMMRWLAILWRCAQVSGWRWMV